jgi:hypothetical protein
MKAFRKVEKTKAPPGCMRFERHTASDAAAAKLRKRAMAERLKGSGSQLADATPKSNPRGQ